jgi:predicted Zn-dependent protease
MKHPRKPRRIPKTERAARALRQIVAYDRSRPQTSARESHLRSLMGLPSREASPP